MSRSADSAAAAPRGHATTASRSSRSSSPSASRSSSWSRCCRSSSSGSGRPTWPSRSPRRRAWLRASSIGCGTCRTTSLATPGATVTCSTTTSRTRRPRRGRSACGSPGAYAVPAVDMDGYVAGRRHPVRLRAGHRSHVPLREPGSGVHRRGEHPVPQGRYRPERGGPADRLRHPGHRQGRTANAADRCLGHGPVLTAEHLEAGDDLHPDRGPAERHQPAQRQCRRDRGSGRIEHRGRRCRLARGRSAQPAGCAHLCEQCRSCAGRDFCGPGHGIASIWSSPHAGGSAYCNRCHGDRDCRRPVQRVCPGLLGWDPARRRCPQRRQWAAQHRDGEQPHAGAAHQQDVD